jgi:omega-6 fatty acid desaturase (delta-12 desaturase)
MTVSEPPSSAPAGVPEISVPEWKAIVNRYHEPCHARASWQVTNTLGSYVALWVLMYFSLSISAWLTYSLAVLAGLMMVRLFIIFHDCGHGSFFRSRRANDIVGFISGVLCLTPYHHWRWEHTLHHATSSDLDRRGTGDVWTITVQEYLESPLWRRIAYRVSRHPLILFLIAPTYLFIVRERFPSPKASARERRSVWVTNLALFAMAAGLSTLFGLKTYLLIQLTVTMVGGAIGVWMFYVQHQFDGAYWERGESWDFTAAALQGSSFYRLPKILQWFTGNIGFHHIHHLSSRIPNYHLERCHESHAIFQAVKPLTIRASLRSLRFHLWDEQQRRLVSFRQIRRRAA